MVSAVRIFWLDRLKTVIAQSRRQAFLKAYELFDIYEGCTGQGGLQVSCLLPRPSVQKTEHWKIADINAATEEDPERS